jgi:LCP family protein required for cell wall assembly
VNEPPVPRLAWGMWKRFIAAAAIIVVLSAVATATAGLLEVRGLAQDISLGKKLNLGSDITEAQAGQPQTILVLGSDIRKVDRERGLRGNSDTIMLIRLDPHKKATAVLSVPRDLKVPLHLRNGRVQTTKINAAYPEGGPRLTVRTIKQVLGIQINHVVNVDFKGFKQAVNHVHCVYVDVDRRYFNDNSGPGPHYATIDIKPGYQKLCGGDALDYVRYRHEDTDLVRAARQQDFLRQAKEQVGVKKVILDRHAFARIFGRYTETDIRGTKALLRIFKLVAFSAGHPIREVHFRTTLGPSFVTSSPSQIRATVNEFLNADATRGPRGTLQSTPAQRLAARRAKRQRPVALGLEDATKLGQDQAIAAGGRVPFPVLYPKLRTVGAVYSDVPRTYNLRDTDGHLHHAYRMVLKKGLVGEYYGVQGMDWMDPPLLDNPSESRKLGKRNFDLYFDGNRLRLVALRTPRAIYYVSNTLLLTLTNKQMLAIARSLSASVR